MGNLQENLSGLDYHLLKPIIWLQLSPNSRAVANHPDNDLIYKQIRPLCYGTRLKEILIWGLLRI